MIMTFSMTKQQFQEALASTKKSKYVQTTKSRQSTTFSSNIMSIDDIRDLQLIPTI